MAQPTLHWLDYSILAIALMVPLYFGLKFSRKQKDTKNFFTASGSIPAWAIGISILATLISSVTFLAYPGEGFKSNWILLVQGIMVPLTLIFFIRFIVPLYRNAIRISAYEYFERRFGFGARIYGSLAFFLAHFSKMGTVFYLVALAFSKMIGVDTLTLIWITGFVVVFITLIGGMEAIIWMDVVQGLTLIVGGILALGILVFSVPGGFSTLWTVAQQNGRVGFGPYDASFVKLTFWVMVLNGIFYAIQKYGTDQTIVQRYLTAKTDKAAVKASLLGISLSVVVWGLFMFIGTALFSYYQINASELPAGIKAEEVFPHFIMTKLPIGVVGLVLAALLSAAIASLSSDLNCLSAICMADYYTRFRPNSSEKSRMIVSKLVIMLAGVAAVFIAMYYVKNQGEGVLGIVFTLYSIFSCGIAGMFLLGIFTSRTNRQGIMVGIVVAILFTSWAVLTSTKIGTGDAKHLMLDLGNWNYTHHKMLLGVYSHFVLFGVGYLSSFFFTSNKEIRNLTYRGWKENNKNN